MSDPIDIPAGTMNAVRSSLRHGMVLIADDVQGIASDLREIDGSLRLYCDPEEDLWVVWQEKHHPDGQVTENLVTTMRGELDKRIVQRVQRAAADDYDLAAELERSDADADREHDHQRRETVGPVAERLLHAMQKDTGVKTRVFIP